MSHPRTKLELTRPWKNKDYRLEPRVLIEKPEFNYGDSKSGNILIHGDNLLALKALEQEFSGKVKCIYIDPPYNTGHAFEHYDDGLEHSEWLCLMKPRLDLLKELLTEDWNIWISIDDDESHYLKILCDEVFGRQNFVANVIWEKKYSPQNDAKRLSDSHDHILVYAKNKQTRRPNLLPRTDEMDSRYKNPDNDPRWIRMSDNLTVKTYSSKYDFPITTPSGRIVNPPSWRCWRFSEDGLKKLLSENRIRFWEDWKNVPRLKRFLTEVKQGSVSKTIWFRGEVGDNQEANKEVKAFNSESVFSTPKPEKLIERIIFLWSNPWDIVLDSFLGSWTTAAVAHKMGRKWIGIELGDHAYTHCKVRLDKVVDGEQWGISKTVEWKGWGGYKFYELWPSVMVQDTYWNYIINPEFNSSDLIQSICKIENFTYKAYMDNIKHGYSTEKDFIHVTTRHITQDIINDIVQNSLKQGETILVVAKTFASDLSLPDCVQMKKIPPEILGKCEYNKNDYSLPVTEQHIDESDEEEIE